MNNNTAIFLDITFLLSLVFALVRTMYLRSRRKEILRKYKKDSYLYKQHVKLMDAKRLVVVLFFTILILLKTVFDISKTLEAHGESMAEDVLFNIVLGVIGVSVVLGLIYFLHKKNDVNTDQ